MGEIIIFKKVNIPEPMARMDIPEYIYYKYNTI